MADFILLEPMGKNATRLKINGNKGAIVKMLADAIVCHPAFRECVLDAVVTAKEYMKKGGPSFIEDLKQNPVHPTEN
ncbi:MAG: hypothetical protein EPGJADBJ_04457 [Saprospiraceae bacterium]|nr:hypothetical protein [Saprospiraceae bacterium]